MPVRVPLPNPILLAKKGGAKISASLLHERLEVLIEPLHARLVALLPGGRADRPAPTPDTHSQSSTEVGVNEARSW